MLCLGRGDRSAHHRPDPPRPTPAGELSTSQGPESAHCSLEHLLTGSFLATYTSELPSRPQRLLLHI